MQLAYCVTWQHVNIVAYWICLFISIHDFACYSPARESRVPQLLTSSAGGWAKRHRCRLPMIKWLRTGATIASTNTTTVDFFRRTNFQIATNTLKENKKFKGLLWNKINTIFGIILSDPPYNQRLELFKGWHM